MDETDPTDDAPLDETPTDEARSEDAPTDEARSEDAPTDEARSEDAPTGDGPTTDAARDARREASRRAIDRMVRSIRPDWRVRGIRPAEDGAHLVYRLDVGTPAGTRECVLKATPPGGPAQNDTEARVLAVLDAHTAIPVPEVHGVVDEAGDLPAPYFLMEAVPGEVLRRTEMDAVDAGTIGWIARESGRHLGRLHDLPAVDRFGYVAADPERPLDGDAPAGTFDELVVTDATDAWREHLRESTAGAVDALEDTRFGGLAGAVRPAVGAAIEDLDGPFEPVLAHVDDQIANHVLDRERRRVTAVIDWGFTLATTPAYDLTFAVHSLAGGPWWYVPSFPDHSARIREALLSGYRETGATGAVERYRSNRECYELVATLHSALHHADRLALDGATDRQIRGAAQRHRAAIEAHL